MINKVKGTQDFIDTSLFYFVIDQAKKHLYEYNYSEIILPIIEHTQLFQRSLGQYTDVIGKEMFLIAPKEGSDESICLRPESTASTVRAFIENSIVQTPWKVFTYGPMFRYERPQKGRFRQFNQISIEVIGSKAITQDALMIKMLDRLFKEKYKLDNFAILINFLGCYDDRKKFEYVLKNFLESVSDKICSTCLERKTKNPLRTFDCKNPDCQKIYLNAPKTTDYLCQTCNQEWDLLKKTLELISVSFAESPKLVRGLDYYNKTVFEFVSANLGAQSTFCGGGRYDNLVHEISGSKINEPAIGAAIGIERIMLLLEPIKDKLNLQSKKQLIVILPMSEKQHILALLISNQLHANELTSDVLLDESSMKSMMRKANKLGARIVLILGEEEQLNRQVTLKDMISGQEQKINQIDLVKYLKEK